MENTNIEQHNAASKIQEWWRNFCYDNESSDNESSDESSSCSESCEESCSDIYPNSYQYEENQEINENQEIKQKGFCDDFTSIFVKVSLIMLLPITYFRVKYYFY